MLKMMSVLNVSVNSRDYDFSCQPDSPLADALEANSQHRAFLLGKQQMANESAVSVESEQPKQEQANG